MVYQIEKRVYEDVDLADEDVMTQKQAANLLGRSVWAISDRMERGALTVVINPGAPSRQGRRLVLRSEIEALLRERGAFEAFERKWEGAAPAEDPTPLSDEEANAVVHEVRRARRG